MRGRPPGASTEAGTEAGTEEGMEAGTETPSTADLVQSRYLRENRIDHKDQEDHPGARLFRVKLFRLNGLLDEPALTQRHALDDVVHVLLVERKQILDDSILVIW
jgi:hypothetical protein